MATLPSSQADFPALRNDHQIYVDKTEFLYKLVTSRNPYFLSRPRRFGKSLLVSTLEAILQGKRELFEGLWISGRDSDYHWRQRPVINLSLTGVDTESASTVKESLNGSLTRSAENVGLTLRGSNPSDSFSFLIWDLHRKHNYTKVAILIDEYDAPILSKIEQFKLANEIREVLKGFYGVLKATEKYWDFVFITGVTKFTRASIFSTLNNLKDLTLKPEFSTICGFTESEFDKYFSEFLEDSLVDLKVGGWLAQEGTATDFRKMIFDLYDGYSWDGKVKVLNPWSVISCLDQRRLGNFWFTSGGTPTFLLKLMSHLPDKFEYLTKDKSISDDLNVIDVDFESIELTTIMFQSGYLTVRTDVEPNRSLFRLDYPNLEVRASLLPLLLNMDKMSIKDPLVQLEQGQALLAAFLDIDPERFAAAFSVVLSNYPSTKQARNEYHKLSLYHAFTLDGQRMELVPPTGDGRQIEGGLRY
jgi:hypothetical protein